MKASELKVSEGDRIISKSNGEEAAAEDVGTKENIPLESKQTLKNSIRSPLSFQLLFYSEAPR